MVRKQNNARKSRKQQRNFVLPPTSVLESRLVIPTSKRAESFSRFVRWTSSPGGSSYATSSVAAEVDASITFALSDLPAYTEFTTLFDQFRFKRVTVHFMPQLNAFSPASQIGASIQVWTAVDFDGAPTTTIAGIQQYDTAKVNYGGSPFSVSFCPRAQMTADAAARFGEAKPGQWFDCAQAATAFNGLLIGIPQGSVNTINYYIAAEYELEFKRTR